MDDRRCEGEVCLGTDVVVVQEAAVETAGWCNEVDLCPCWGRMNLMGWYGPSLSHVTSRDQQGVGKGVQREALLVATSQQSVRTLQTDPNLTDSTGSECSKALVLGRKFWKALLVTL